MSALLFRGLRFEGVATDLAADALIPVTIATDTPVTRYGGMTEVLDCTPAGVDLSRAPLSLITSHDSSQLAVGLVEELQATGQRVTGMVRFGSSPEAQQIRADVIAGIHRYLSVGYSLLDEGRAVEGGFLYRWQPHEVSIVSVPADPVAGFFRSTSGVPPMNAIVNPDAAEITTLCRRHKVEDLAAAFIQRGLDLAAVRTEVLEILVTRDLAAGGHRNNISSAPPVLPDASGRELIVNTLAARMGLRTDKPIIHSIGMVGLAVRALNLDGHRVSDSDSRDQILQRAFRSIGHQGVSDFPAMLGDAVGRVMAASYQRAPSPLKSVARLANMDDFRAKSVVRIGTPSLERVNEHGEFKYGQIPSAASGWKLLTYGKIIALTRQAMVNDDLLGFSALVEKFGHSAAAREAEELAAVLLAPPAIDGAALFSAERSTLVAAPLTLAGLGVAVRALRNQKDLDGSLVSQEPTALVVPSALEMTARQLAATFTATQSGDVQPFTFSVVVEPRLDAASDTAWYLVAGNQSALEYGYLDGQEGVQIMQEEGFDVDGLRVKARLDFGCGWVAPVGWVKSTGAGA